MNKVSFREFQVIPFFYQFLQLFLVMKLFDSHRSCIPIFKGAGNSLVDVVFFESVFYHCHQFPA